nr:hypothetical protein [Tanacetum cinerariifolium]
MVRQCTEPKRHRNSAWFKEKAMLTEALESTVVLDEEHMSFLVDNGDTVTIGQTAVHMAKLSLYDLDVLSKHDALSVIDTKESLELAEESGLKMHAKQNDPIAKDEKVNIAPIDYAALNKLSKNFVRHFVPQKQLYAK